MSDTIPKNYTTQYLWTEYTLYVTICAYECMLYQRQRVDIQDMRDADLEDLIEQAAEGSEKAFHEIFERTHDRLFTYAASHTSMRDDALDIVQETFVELWSGLSRFQYQSDEAFYGFTFIILKRKLYRYYRKRPKTVCLSDKIPDDTYEMEHEDYRYLLKHMHALTKRYQDLLKLRYWGGLSYREIALNLNITENAAKVGHHRAIEKLKTSLKEYNNAT